MPQPPSSERKPVKVDICVSTMGRPDWLRMLMEGLSSQQTRTPRHLDVRVIVVDNDSGRTGCRAIGSSAIPEYMPIVCVHEPRRGIPMTRNAAVGLVRHDADFVAFVDDDEVPEPDWLQRLLEVAESTGCGAVGGPVVPSSSAALPRGSSRAASSRPRLIRLGPVYR